jgi:hypothetical protein
MMAKIDCYIIDYRIALEIDEFGHKDRKKQIEIEIERQKCIEEKLNCTFLRTNPDDDNFCIYAFIGQIFAEINKKYC